MAFKVCCSCNRVIPGIGLWGNYTLENWSVDFPPYYVKYLNTDTTRLPDCNVLIVGRWSFSTPFSAQPTTSGDRTAVSDWITAGGVLFVVHDYYGNPSDVPSNPVTALNDFLSAIGSLARPVFTAGPAPTPTTFPSGVKDVTGSHAVIAGVDKLYVAAPGFMARNGATLLMEARKTSSDAYVDILSIESYGSGFIVFLSDFSALNDSAALSTITTGGNKIKRFLRNLPTIATNYPP